MYWLSLKFYGPDDHEVRLTPHLGVKRDAKLLFDLLYKLCRDSCFPCKIKLYKNTEVIERANFY